MSARYPAGPPLASEHLPFAEHTWAAGRWAGTGAAAPPAAPLPVAGRGPQGVFVVQGYPPGGYPLSGEGGAMGG